MNNFKDKMVIQWSNIDNFYLVRLSYFPCQKWRTHGHTYTEAVNNGVEVLALLIEDYQLSGDTLSLFCHSPKPVAIYKLQKSCAMSDRPVILEDKIKRTLTWARFHYSRTKPPMNKQFGSI